MQFHFLLLLLLFGKFSGLSFPIELFLFYLFLEVLLPPDFLLLLLLFLLLPGHFSHLLFFNLTVSFFQREFLRFFSQPLSLLFLKLFKQWFHSLLGSFLQLLRLQQTEFLQNCRTGIVAWAQVVLPLLFDKDLSEHPFNAIFGALGIEEVEVFHHLLLGVQRSIGELDEFGAESKDGVVVFDLLFIGFLTREWESLRGKDYR